MQGFGSSVRSRGRAVAAAVAVLALLLTSPAAVVAGRSRASSIIGYDISYPQCGKAFPDDAAFQIVGVNGGLVFSPNPCLGAGDDPSELTWAGGSNAQLYANTGNPGPALSTHWPTGQTFPLPCNTAWSTGPDTANCAYDYGWNAAADSYRTAVQAFISLGFAAPDAARTPFPMMWWLDVEITNSWRDDVTLNIAVLEGEVAYLKSMSPAGIGFYSNQYQWNEITGGTRVFARYPSWVAGATTFGQAAINCGVKAFNGGRVLMAQFFSKGFDADLSC